MKQLTLIGWYLIIIFAAVLLTMILTGCSKKTYEHLMTDTLIVERVESVIVHMREVPVDIPVPGITLSERVPLCDTLLILDNGLYKSEVLIKNGQVSHSLAPSSADASLHATVAVADTTHTVTTEKESIHNEVVLQTIDKPPNAWQRLKVWAADKMLTITFTIAVIVVIFFCILRRRQKENSNKQ